jgi:protein-disulfide isomerase
MPRPRAALRGPAVLIALLLLVVPGTASASAGRPYPGVRERGELLGRRTAPARIVLFADLKCPACAPFERTVLPTVVRRLVRTGRASIELRLVNIIDENVGTSDGARLRTAA